MSKKSTPNNQWNNTHFYDNNMSKEVINIINRTIKSFNSVSSPEKLEGFKNLRKTLIEKGLTKNGIGYYDQMIDIYSTNITNKNKNITTTTPTTNYDPINKMDAIDLLYGIYIISLDNKDIIPILSEQLNDMRTGFCPQGRTIRLIQIIFSFG